MHLRFRRPLSGLLALLALSATRPLQGQGLPAFERINPVLHSRSGLYFQPYQDPAPAGSRWRFTAGLDYASTIELNTSRRGADYLLDTELLRLGVTATRDLGRNAFLRLDAGLYGAYDGFMDGFLDWYHGLLGIRMPEREARPQDRFAYRVALPDGITVERGASGAFLGDLRAGVGVRTSRRAQTMLSLTVPTSTGPAGFGRGTVSVSLLETVRLPVSSRGVFEGSAGVGHTPRRGELAAYQRAWFGAASSGLRYRVWGGMSLFANLYVETPAYAGTGLPALDRRTVALDFGWIHRSADGGEWRIGMTEDLEPSGPAIDLIFRLGRRF